MGPRQRTGKLDAATLARLLDRYAATTGGSLLIGPAVGVDAAAVAAEEGVYVFASDPVTYAGDGLGTYAVHVNANDIFVSGARPLWFLADILLSPDRGDDAEDIFIQIYHACAELGVTLIGGHTEITPGLPRPMVAGFMIGRAVGDNPISAAHVRPGDAIVLSKGVAIEGTAAIAGQFERQLRAPLGWDLVARAREFLTDPGLSVGPEARIALDCGAHAMHDPTEGGLLNGLWEMSQAAGLTLHVDLDRVPVYPETAVLCEHFGLDPLRLLASGALLAACAEADAEDLVAALSAEGTAAAVIGRAEPGPPGVHWPGGSLTEPVADEMLKLFGEVG